MIGQVRDESRSTKSHPPGSAASSPHHSAKEPARRGDIVVSFDIQFPDRLSQNTKDLLYDLLPAK